MLVPPAPHGWCWGSARGAGLLAPRPTLAHVQALTSAADLADDWTRIRLFPEDVVPSWSHTHVCSHTHTHSVHGRQGRTPSGLTQSLEVIPPPTRESNIKKRHERFDGRDRRGRHAGRLCRRGMGPLSQTGGLSPTVRFLFPVSRRGNVHVRGAVLRIIPAAAILHGSSAPDYARAAETRS